MATLSPPKNNATSSCQLLEKGNVSIVDFMGMYQETWHENKTGQKSGSLAHTPDLTANRGFRRKSAVHAEIDTIKSGCYLNEAVNDVK